MAENHDLETQHDLAANHGLKAYYENHRMTHFSKKVRCTTTPYYRLKVYTEHWTRYSGQTEPEEYQWLRTCYYLKPEAYQRMGA